MAEEAQEPKVNSESATNEVRNPFRDPVQNIRWTKALFFETTGVDKSTVLYTLKDVDHKGFPSFYRLYMEIDDPTEWEVSQQLVDGWDHWEMLCRSAWFQPYIKRWRKELELRFKSKALYRIRQEAKVSNGRDSLASNKYLLEKGWEAKEGQRKGRGRPTRDEINQAAHDLARASNQLSDDFERLGLAKGN